MTLLDVFSPLTALELALQQADYDTVYSAPGEIDDQPFEQLAILLNEADQPEAQTADQAETEPEFIVRLLFANDVVKAMASSVTAPPERLIVLQFILDLPEQPSQAILGKQAPLGEQALLVNLANQRIPMGAFLLDPAQGISFRYTLACESREVHPLIVAEIIEVIQTYLDHPIKPLRDYLAGRSDYTTVRKILEN
jgi:hypothetical protein